MDEKDVSLQIARAVEDKRRPERGRFRYSLALGS